MRHAFIDEYSGRDSILRRRDPRAKIASFIACVLFIIATPAPSFHTFGLHALMLAGFVAVSGIPFLFVAKRAAAAVPFIFCIGILALFSTQGIALFSYRIGLLTITLTHRGLLLFWNMAAKSLLSVAYMTVLVNSTPFSDLLKGFEKLKIPPLFITIIAFMYRYLFVLEDELEKMLLAKQSRTAGMRRWPQIKVLSNMLGVLFIRSYERAEAVYAAMRCRGFNGSIHTAHDFRFSKRDAYFVAVVIILLTSILYTGV